MVKKIAKGDPVLVYGRVLHVVDLDEVEGIPRAVLADLDGRKAREEAAAKVASLREGQATLTGRRHEEVAEEINELDNQARQVLFGFKLRRDLLTFWPEKDVWVSEGRILNEEQIAKFREVTGHKPRPDAQRQALTILEAMGA